MTQIYLGIGSNINREATIRHGLKALESYYGELHISPIYESKAYGFDGDDFLNLVAGFDCNVEIEDLEKHLKAIEHQSGRNHSDSSYCSRTLDIDLLLYGDLISEKYELPRSDIIQYAFVLKPLFDIAPDLLHPVEKKTIKEIWRSFNDPEQRIEEVSSQFIS